jgi:hypothetical protein
MASDVSYPITAVMNLYVTAVMNLYITAVMNLFHHGRDEPLNHGRDEPLHHTYSSSAYYNENKRRENESLKCRSNWLRIRPLQADRFSYFETSN